MNQVPLYYALKFAAYHELILISRRTIDMVIPLLFFILVVTLFVLSTQADMAQLRHMAPGVIWVGALLAILLSLDQLFRDDFHEGVIEQWLLSAHPLPLLVTAKIFMRWLAIVLPLLCLAPILAAFMHLSSPAILMLSASLALGTLPLYFIGAVGAALTLGLPNAALLLALLILPFYVPVLIFGASVVSLVEAGARSVPQFYFLLGTLLIALSLAPLAVSAILRLNAKP